MNIDRKKAAGGSDVDDIKFTLPGRLFGGDKKGKIEYPTNRQRHSPFVLKCVDCHAGGEPARVVMGGCTAMLNRHHMGSDDDDDNYTSLLCSSAYDKRRYMMEHLDDIRRLLIEEPRGYPCQNVNFVFASAPTEKKDDDGEGTPDTDHDETTNGRQQKKSPSRPVIQYVIGEQNNVWPMMSGHNTMCVATALIECGVVDGEITENNDEPVVDNDSTETTLTSTRRFDLEAPCGLITIEAKCREDGNGCLKAESITIRNQPAFVEILDLMIDVPYVGSIKCDIAWGSGMWYCVVDIDQPTLQQLQQQQHQSSTSSSSTGSLKIDRSCAKQLCRIGERIKVACREQHPVEHPTLHYDGVDILVFIEQPTRRPYDGRTKYSTWSARNTVVMSNTYLRWDDVDTHTAMLDRSPCGTGTCAVMAVHHSRGVMKVGDTLVHESIIGTTFRGKILEETTIVGYHDDDTKWETTKVGIIPTVEGTAYITQYSEVVVDPDDPFPNGYSIGDIW